MSASAVGAPASIRRSCVPSLLIWPLPSSRRTTPYNPVASTPSSVASSRTVTPGRSPTTRSTSCSRWPGAAALRLRAPGLGFALVPPAAAGFARLAGADFDLRAGALALELVAAGELAAAFDLGAAGRLDSAPGALRLELAAPAGSLAGPADAVGAS